MKKVIALVLAAVMLLSAVGVMAEDIGSFQAGKHSATAVVNFEGKIDKEHIAAGAQVTALIIENPGTEEERIAYIEEYEVDEFGKFGAKFVCKASDNSVLSVRYNGKEINDSLITSSINVVESNIVLLTDREGVFDLSARGEMPVKEYSTHVNKIPKTYQSDYTFDEVTGTKAYIEVKNTFGINEKYTPMIACYDKDNKMVGVKIFDEETLGFEDKEKVTLTEVVDLPEGTVRAKAFAWDEDTLVPIGDSNQGKLPKINVVLAGASTAWSVPPTLYPLDGFGKFFGDYFNEEYVAYTNKSVSGANTTSYLEKHWADALSLIGEGDYLIMELGGNDRGITSNEQFKENLLKMYEDVTAKGGNIMFVGVTVDINDVADDGKYFKHDTGRLRMTSMKREIAEYTGSDFVSCEDALLEFYNKEVDRLGSIDAVRGTYFRTKEYLMKPEAEGGFGLAEEDVYISSSDPTKTYDYTHTNMRAADMVAQKFYEAIAKSDSPLRFYFK